jgi:hypothetical protein
MHQRNRCNSSNSWTILYARGNNQMVVGGDADVAAVCGVYARAQGLAGSRHVCRLLYGTLEGLRGVGPITTVPSFHLVQHALEF